MEHASDPLKQGIGSEPISYGFIWVPEEGPQSTLGGVGLVYLKCLACYTPATNVPYNKLQIGVAQIEVASIASGKVVKNTHAVAAGKICLLRDSHSGNHPECIDDSHPRESSRSTRLDPINPAPPVTSTSSPSDLGGRTSPKACVSEQGSKALRYSALSAELAASNAGFSFTADTL